MKPVNKANELLIKLVDNFPEIKNVSVFMNQAIGFGYQFSFNNVNLIITRNKIGNDCNFEIHYAVEAGNQETYQSMIIGKEYASLADALIQKIEAPVVAQIQKSRKFSFWNYDHDSKLPLKILFANGKAGSLSQEINSIHNIPSTS